MKIRIRQTAVSVPMLCAAMVSMGVLAGCANITGLDGSSQYGCAAPEGVKCDSVSGNYYNAIQNNLPAQRNPKGTANPSSLTDPQSPSMGRDSGRNGASATPTAIGAAVPVEGPAYMAAPLRAGPRVLRLWIKPWEDADHDLNGESLVYVQVDNGRWLVDHVQRQAREPYAPIRPTRLPTSAAGGSVTDPSQEGQSTADDGSPINQAAQALRALQGRPLVTTGN